MIEPEKPIKPEIYVGCFVRHVLLRFEVVGKVLRRDGDAALVAWESPINKAKWEALMWLSREDA